jgi:octaprenyl-diphosphate synthase
VTKLSSKINDKVITPLDKLRGFVAADLQKVDALIYELIKSKASLIPEISSHTITSGGKRLRPMLTLACADMCGYSGAAHIELAASVEFIHTATLLHDDVVDKSDLRRGVLTANSVWGNKESVLVGDFLLGKAFELMGSASSLEVYKVLSNAAVVISEGEVKQLAVTGKLDISKEEYFEVINSKTAELFAAACQIGGVIANKGDAEVAALRNYGLNLGSAFQIIDDLLDYSADKGRLGKDVGDDFREKKVTLPVIIAYQNSDAKGREFWQKCFSKNTVYDVSCLKMAIKLINDTGSAQETVKIAELIAAKAARSLDIFTESSIKKMLLDVLHFVVARNF